MMVDYPIAASMAAASLANRGRFIPGARTLPKNSTAARRRGNVQNHVAVDPVPADTSDWERAYPRHLTSGDAETQPVFEAEGGRQIPDLITRHAVDALA